VAVPWGAITADRKKYLDDRQVAANVVIREPSKMSAVDVRTLYNFWLRKQTKNEDVFRFKSVDPTHVRVPYGSRKKIGVGKAWVGWLIPMARSLSSQKRKGQWKRVKSGRGRVGKWTPIALSTFSFIDTSLRADGKKITHKKVAISPSSHSPSPSGVASSDSNGPIRGPIGPPLKKRPVPRPATNPTGEVGERRVDVGKGKGQGSGRGENQETTLSKKAMPREKPKGKDGGLAMGVEPNPSPVAKRKRGEDEHERLRAEKRPKPKPAVEDGEEVALKPRDAPKRRRKRGDEDEEASLVVKTRLGKSKEVVEKGRSLRSRVVLR
jgi:hypothetical protein